MSKRYREMLKEKCRRVDGWIVYLSIFSALIISFTVRMIYSSKYLDYKRLTIVKNTSNIFTYQKLILLIVFVCIITGVFLYRNNINPDKLRKDYVMAGIAAVCASAVISTFLSELKYVSFWGYYTRNNGLLAYLGLFFLMYIVSNLSIDNRHLKYLINTITVMSMVFVLIGVFQFYGNNIMTSEWFKRLYIPPDIFKATNIVDSISERSVVSSLLPHYNYFGGYCSIFFPLLSAFALRSRELFYKVFYGTGSVMLFIGVIMASSQGGYITMMFIVVPLLLFYLNRENLKMILIMFLSYGAVAAVIFIGFSGKLNVETKGLIEKITGKGSTIIVIAAAIILVAFMLYLRKYLYKYKAKALIYAIIISFVLMSASFMYIMLDVVKRDKGLFTSRGYAWYYTGQMLKERFIVGYGPDTFYYNFPQVNPDTKEYSLGKSFDKPHNMYLQIAADTGIIGLGGFLLLLVGYLISLAKAIEKEEDPVKKDFYRASILVTAAYMVQGMVNDNHLSIQPILYTVLGIGMAASWQTLKMEVKPENQDDSRKGKRKKGRKEAAALNR